MTTQLSQLVALTADMEFFRTPDGNAYATVPVNGHHETWEVKSPQFSRLLLHRYYGETAAAARLRPLQEAIRMLEAKAHFDGAEHPVFLRLAEHGGRIYLDLANEEWQVIEIDADGWRIVPTVVKFRRAHGMLPLPTPARGGSIDELRPVTNLGNDLDWQLFVAGILSALRASGPYPIVVFHGEQGCSKSTLARMVRALIDPNTVPLRIEPQTVHDLMIAASNSWVLSFDNLSRIPGWFSDALCLLATGGGHSTRELYSNTEEALLHVQRPVILTGIGELATRSDLLSRCVRIELPPIPPRERRPERELWREFDAARPRILGGLLDIVAAALKRLPTTNLPHHPRMADFAAWVSAAEPSLGWPGGTFLKAYEEDQASANDLALEASCITAPLFALLRKRPFEGTAAALLHAIAQYTDDATTKQRGWPRTPRGLSEILRRLAPNLRAAGVELEFRKLPCRQRTRLISIHFSASEPSAASEELAIEAVPVSHAVELQAADLRNQRFDKLRQKIDGIINKAEELGDFKNAVAGVRESIRIEEIERKGHGHLDEQTAFSNALPAALRPLPGNPGARALTECEKQALAEIEKCSPADRMAMREGFSTAVSLADLARRPLEPKDE